MILCLYSIHFYIYIELVHTKKLCTLKCLTYLCYYCPNIFLISCDGNIPFCPFLNEFDNESYVNDTCSSIIIVISSGLVFLLSKHTAAICESATVAMTTEVANKEKRQSFCVTSSRNSM